MYEIEKYLLELSVIFVLIILAVSTIFWLPLIKNFVFQLNPVEVFYVRQLENYSTHVVLCTQHISGV